VAARSVTKRSRRAETYLPLAYFGIALLLVVALLPSVLRPPQTPPTQTAELSPDAPPDKNQQSLISSFNRGNSGTPGQGSGIGTGPGAGGAPPPTARPVIAVPSAHRCYGDPPRQIEDPQGPPCVPAWRGDNGGATAKGVTGTEVRVAVPVPTGIPNVPQEYVRALETFFNKRFELYGRQLRLIWDPNGNNNEDYKQTALAVKVDAEYHAFASSVYIWAGGWFYHQELARRGVVSAMGLEGVPSRAMLSEKRPYLWSYPMAADGMFANLGEWGCKRLAGGNAAHAGAELTMQKRKFGVILRPKHDDMKFSLDPLIGELDQCGAHPALVVPYPAYSAPSGGGSQTDQKPAEADIAFKMREAGVTTIFCLCEYLYEKQLWASASEQGYHPEWIGSSFGAMDSDFDVKNPIVPQAPEQTAHLFGLTFTPRQVGLASQPFWWAAREGDPAIGQPGSFADFWMWVEVYRSLLLIASGIQMAGPHLTPLTFQDALQRAQFPNPDSPLMAGKVGFNGGSNAMTVDGAEWWWSNSETSPYGTSDGFSQGTVCYVNGGARHSIGTWLSGGDPFFTGHCDAGATAG